MIKRKVFLYGSEIEFDDTFFNNIVARKIAENGPDAIGNIIEDLMKVGFDPKKILPKVWSELYDIHKKMTIRNNHICQLISGE